MGTKSTTTYTFAVTFQAPQGMSILAAGKTIKAALIDRPELELFSDKDIKVYLTNKETSYGKR